MSRRLPPRRLPAHRPTPRSRATGASFDVRRFAGGLEGIAKGTAALTVGLYILGLLSVNGYLFWLGVSDFTLVRPRFVYTGALIGATFLISAVGLGLGGSSIYEHWKQGMPIYHPLGIIVLLMTLPLPLAFLSVFFLRTNSCEYRGQEPCEASWGLALSLANRIYIVGIIAATLIVIGITLATIPARNRPIALTYASSAYYLFGIVLVLAGYAAYFMATIYPMVPVQFGGGRPVAARLLISHTDVSSAKIMGLPFPPKGDLSNPVSIAYQGDQSYVIIIPPDGAIVTGDRKSVV